LTFQSGELALIKPSDGWKTLADRCKAWDEIRLSFYAEQR